MAGRKVTEEKGRPSGHRLFERHRKMLEKRAEKEGVSEAEINRRAIESYCV